MPRESARLEELDAFRGIAAIWVVLYHFLARYLALYADPADLDDVALAFDDLFATVGGLLPVFLFFMISGFVINWTLESAPSWRDFAVLRATRLYPAYWTAVLLTLVAILAVPLPNSAISPLQAVASLTMLQDFLGIDSLDGSWWSLAVELLFYGWMMAALVCGQLGRMPWIALAWAGLCLAAHALASRGIPVPWHARRLLLLDHGHFFAAGIAMYGLWRGRAAWIGGTTLVVCAASILLSYPWPYALVCLGFILLFLLALQGHLRWLATEPLLWLGRISYSLYICHEAIGWRVLWGLDGAGLPHLASSAVALAVVLGLADLITRLVEQPAMRGLRALWRAGYGRR
jgi:peptidoglycan/LPS O-acetylase OafA/YrhL